MKRIYVFAILLFALLSQACGAQSFLQNAARVHSLTKGARQILENIYDDKLMSREGVLEIARPLQRFQSGQVEVFDAWKRNRNPDTGELSFTPEVAAEIAKILITLRSDLAAMKQKANKDTLPSPITPMLAPALDMLEKSFGDFAGYLQGLKGVSRKSGVWRILKAENDQMERIYAEMLKESGEMAWIQ